MKHGTHLILGDTGRAHDRVVRIVNFHYEAAIPDIYKFFGDDFKIIDFLRSINLKSKKHTVGYVLFATEQERINAQMLSDHQLLDRKVKILPAYGGFYSMLDLIMFEVVRSQCPVSPAGDRLLPSSASETVTSDENSEQFVTSPPALDDKEAFPSLSVVATSLQSQSSLKNNARSEAICTATSIAETSTVHEPCWSSIRRQ